MIQNKLKYIVFVFSIAVVAAGLLPIWGDTVVWKPSGEEAGFYLDVPPDWEKDYEIKKNGVIFSAVYGGLSMTVKSYAVEQPVSAREVLNQRAAHLSGRNSYIYLLREKILGEEGWGVIAYWKLYHRKKSYREKTIIYVKDNSVLMLICSGPEKEFEKAKVIFDNAILSFGFYDPEIELDPGVIRYEMAPPSNNGGSPASSTQEVEESTVENSPEAGPGEDQEAVIAPEIETGGEDSPEKESDSVESGNEESGGEKESDDWVEIEGNTW